MSNPETKLTQDGKPDHRFKEHGGGSAVQGTEYIEEGDGTSRLATQGTGEEEGVHKPSLHGGKKIDGSDDSRVSSDHGFGSESGADPSEAGKKGGESSYENDRLTH